MRKGEQIMKRRIISSIIATLLAATMLLNIIGCGNSKTDEKDNAEAIEENLQDEQEEISDAQAELSEEPVESEQMANDNENEELESVDLLVETQESEQTTENEEVKFAAMSNSDYVSIIDALRETEPVSPSNADILSEMCDCVSFARILGDENRIFSEMDDMDKFSLRFQIINSVLYGQSQSYEDIVEKINDETVIPLEKVKELFHEYYGEENFVPYEYERVEDGYYYPLFADGEGWQIISSKQFFEDDDYILISGPGFYESNGGDEGYLGYADILLKKNPDSRLGVTLLCGRYRDHNIGVSSVETSSELPKSGDKTYSGENLVDGDPLTVWAEGVPGTGEGETIVLHLDEKQPVCGVLICNGYTAGYEEYTNNGMLTEVSVDFGDGNVVTESMMEGYAYENFSAENLADINRTRIGLEEPVVTDTIVITVTGAKAGTKYDDTCVSEVLVY